MCGAAAAAKGYGDEKLKAACRRFSESIANRRMYITGGIGFSNIGKACAADYDLPNRTAYSKGCVLTATAMFANRRLSLGADSHYADITRIREQ